MAASTPAIWGISGQVFRLDDRMLIGRSPYAGAGAHRESRLRIYSDAGGTVTVWDSLLIEDDDWIVGTQWFEVWPAWWDAAAGTGYWAGLLDRNTLDETSSQSALVSFTMEAAPLSKVRWAEHY
jgi:hypothetical protein